MTDKENFPVHITAIDGFTAVMQDMQKKLGVLSDAFEKNNKSLSSVPKNSGWNKFSSQLSSAKDDASDLTKSLGSLAAPEIAGLIGGGLGLNAIRNYASEFANYSRNVDLAGKRSTFLNQQIQSITGAAKLAGMDTGNLNDQLVDFDQIVRGSVYNNAGSAAIFKSIGVATTAGGPAANGRQNVRPSMEVFKDLAAYYKTQLELGNGQGAENAIRGLGLTQFIPLFAQGREGIEQAESIQNTYGFRATKEEGAQGKDLFSAEAKSRTAWDNLTQSIGAGTAPAFTRLNEQAAIWMKNAANSRELGNGLGESLSVITTALVAVGSGFEAIGEHIGLWHDGVEAVVRLIDGALIAALLKASAVFMSTPLGMFLTLAAGAAAAGTMIGHPQESANAIDKAYPEIGDKLNETRQYYSDLFAGKYGGEQALQVEIKVHGLPAGASASAAVKTPNGGTASTPPAKVFHDPTGHGS